ncbi:MAG TPA: hypothetical protein VGK34_06090 [Armatimonadota bacterium]|jgi:hypothetical protein
MRWSRVVKYLGTRASSDGGFSDAIDSVKPLLAEYGVELQQVESGPFAGRIEYVVRGQSAHIQMVISTEKQLILMSAAPLGYHDPKYPYMTGVDLSTILMVLAPELQRAPKYTGSPAKLRDELEEQVRLLTEYCRPMLEGDDSQWTSILEFKQFLAGPADGETTESWVLRMKSRLIDALDNKNYLLAERICWNLRLRQVALSADEKRGCRLATRVVEKSQRH